MHFIPRFEIIVMLMIVNFKSNFGNIANKLCLILIDL